MFDIGQNDIAGAFYSKTFDQIVASFPLILTEFETGIKVSFSYYTKHRVFNHFLFKFHLYLFISTTQKSWFVWFTFQRLYDNGARNFWIHNTGPVGCLTQNVLRFGTDPLKLDELGCVSKHNQAARLFNLQLHALSKKLQGQYSDANVTYVDIYTIKSNLIANYTKYG